MKNDGRREEDGLDEMERFVASFEPLRPSLDAAERILAPARREERKALPATRPLWHPSRWTMAWERFCNGLGELVVAGRWGLATTTLLFALNLVVDAVPGRLLERESRRGFLRGAARVDRSVPSGWALLRQRNEDLESFDGGSERPGS